MSRRPLFTLLAGFLLAMLLAGCEKTPRPKTLGAAPAIEHPFAYESTAATLLQLRAHTYITV